MTDTKRLVLKVSAPISGMDDSYNLVEYEDGTINQIHSNRIKFLDTQGLMSEICFEEEKGGEE